MFINLVRQRCPETQGKSPRAQQENRPNQQFNLIISILEYQLKNIHQFWYSSSSSMCLWISLSLTTDPAFMLIRSNSERGYFPSIRAQYLLNALLWLKLNLELKSFPFISIFLFLFLSNCPVTFFSVSAFLDLIRDYSLSFISSLLAFYSSAISFLSLIIIAFCLSLFILFLLEKGIFSKSLLFLQIAFYSSSSKSLSDISLNLSRISYSSMFSTSNFSVSLGWYSNLFLLCSSLILIASSILCCSFSFLLLSPSSMTFVSTT